VKEVMVRSASAVILSMADPTLWQGTVYVVFWCLFFSLAFLWFFLKKSIQVLFWRLGP